MKGTQVEPRLADAAISADVALEKMRGLRLCLKALRIEAFDHGLLFSAHFTEVAVQELERLIASDSKTRNVGRR